MTIPAPLLEAIKEGFRIVVLSVIPVLLLQLEQDSINPKALALVGVIAGLRFIDKWLHEVGKENDNLDLKKGLTRF